MKSMSPSTGERECERVCACECMCVFVRERGCVRERGADEEHLTADWRVRGRVEGGERESLRDDGAREAG